MSSSAQRKPRESCEALWARRQAEILDVAAELFAERGFSDADTQLLAERLGVGKGTIYRYFDSKRALFLATVDRVMRNLLAVVLAEMSPRLDPRDKLEAGIVAFLRFFEAHPGYVELLMQERALFKDRVKPTVQEHREANVHRWRPLYQSLMDAGRMRAMPVDRCMSLVGNLLYGTIFTNYVTRRTESADVQAREIIDILFHGLLSDAERSVRSNGPNPATIPCVQQAAADGESAPIEAPTAAAKAESSAVESSPA